MRNGDYTPTRIEAQNDAVTMLFNAKTQSNPENTVGLMTAAGKRLALDDSFRQHQHQHCKSN
jgi:26S proteasome regulatory subunit N10